MRLSTVFVFLLPVAAFAQSAPIVDIPASVPANMAAPMVGPEGVSNANRPQDYFGRVKDPRLEASDPYDSAQTVQGRDPSAEGLPGASARVLEDVSKRVTIQSGSNPTVAITYGQMVSVLLLRDGRVIMPDPRTSAVTPAPEKLVQTMLQANSPYIYVRAKEGQVWPAGNYPYTQMFVSVLVDGHPVQYQIRLRAVGPTDVSLKPLVMLDLVGDLPDAYADSSLNSGAVGGTVSSDHSDSTAPASSSGEIAPYVLGSSAPASARAPLTRVQIRKVLPTMIDMAKLYPSAVYDHAPGYSAADIMAFSPTSIKDGRVVRGRVPTFKNPSDNQLYYLVAGFYFPKYDGLLYEYAFANATDHDLWWDYSLTKILFGTDNLANAYPVTVATPEYYEVTPPGKKNILWVFLQGHGIGPSSPVRIVFPPMGVGATVPALTSPPSSPQYAPSNPEMTESSLDSIH